MTTPPTTQLVDGIYAVDLGGVNVYLLDSDDGLVLIDSGVSGSADTIMRAIVAVDKPPDSLKHILITHLHPDHMGSAAALKRATGAQVYAHPLDAPIIKSGSDFDPSQDIPRPFHPAPGMETIFAQMISPVDGVEGVGTLHELNDGDALSALPALKTIHAPGHSAGQIVFLLDAHGGILFAADTCANFDGLSYSIGYEDIAVGQQTLKMLGKRDFAMATFGHGMAMIRDASKTWREKWG